MPEKAQSSDLLASYCRSLNSHGYGFQHAVLRKAMVLVNARRSKWLLEVTEFPVEVRGQGTRIDFILSLSGRSPIAGEMPILHLVAECKRVNPAVGNWCFAAAPFVCRNNRPQIILQRLVEDDSGRQFAKIVRASIGDIQPIHHIALELRTNERGDADAKGRGAIEEAATQVCRGVNGLADFCARTCALRAPIFLPAVFTTARLWTSDIDLSEADIATGNLTPDGRQMREVKWLLYQYHQSPGLKHSLDGKDRMAGLGGYFLSESARTIAVVGASGIEDFLGVNWPEILS